ncbi:MAG: AbrB/MazE/SpoVT family DNA-binding domain-containing protein [Burkholderiales bacterium]
MELVFKKLGNSTGLTFPASFLREHRLSEGQSVNVDAKPDGTLILIPKAPRKRYSAAELNAQCDLSAPMPADLQEWERAPHVGSETL